MKLENVKMVCVVDSHHGIYIAQKFAEYYKDALIKNGYKSEDLAILLKGPDHENYVEVWSELLPVTLKDDSGNEFVFDCIGDDSDIWEIPKEEYDQIEWE